MEKQIAIIDDRPDVRQRLLKGVSRYFEEHNINLDIKDYSPFQNIEDYPEWIVHNKIVLLIVDERLKEQPIAKDLYSTYDGHELVSTIRKYNKELPIYIITTHSEDEQLTDNLGDYNDIIDREKFEHDSNQYMKRIFRSTQSYIENFEKEFLRLSELSKKYATNSISGEEKDELQALQAKLEIPLSSFSRINRTEWLNEMEGEVAKLQELESRIKKYLSK